MDFLEMLEHADRAVHVSRAFGEPIVRGETTVVPVALVAGGGGMGSGTEKDGTEGGGGGGGLAVRPLGVLVVDEAGVRFRPIVTPEGLLKAAAWFLLAVGVLVRRRRR